MLQHINERIRVNGVPIDDEELGVLLDELDQARQRWAAGLDGFVPIDRVLTYFELMTAAAFVHFASQALDVVVIEVGMGGRLDATNVVDPLVTAITSVGLDHTDQLGSDLGSIAGEKAGIIKPGRPVVTGAMSAESLRVVRAIAHDRGAPLYAHEEAWRVEIGREGTFRWCMGERDEMGLRLGLTGDHQVLNAGVALTVLSLVADRLPVADWAVVLSGLASAEHPGRLEWLRPDLLVDAAHNVQGATALARYLDGVERSGPRVLLLGASNDKDVRAMMGPLAGQFDMVYTTHCAHPRATPAGDLAKQLVDVKVPVFPAGPIEEALEAAMGGEGLVVAAGSVFLAGAVRELVSLRS